MYSLSLPASLPDSQNASAQHWCALMPIESLRLLSIYQKLREQPHLNPAIKAILHADECKREAKALAELNERELQTVFALFDPLITITHNKQTFRGENVPFCSHSHLFLQRFLANLEMDKQLVTLSSILQSFEAMYRPLSIKNAVGETIQFPLPANYVVRPDIIRQLQVAVGKSLKLPRILSTKPCPARWVIISGRKATGKSTLLAVMLRELQVQKSFDSVMAFRFADDSDVESLLRQAVEIQRQKIQSGGGKKDLLVMDNFNWNDEIAVQANILTGLFKCVLVTSSRSDWSCCGIKSKCHVVKVPDGLQKDETLSFFCKMFKCSKDQVSPSHIELLQSMYNECKGCPLKLKIILNAASRFKALTLREDSAPQWKKFFRDFVKSQGTAPIAEPRAVSLEEKDEDGWVVVTKTPPTEEVPIHSVFSLRAPSPRLMRTAMVDGVTTPEEEKDQVDGVPFVDSNQRMALYGKVVADTAELVDELHVGKASAKDSSDRDRAPQNLRKAPVVKKTAKKPTHIATVPSGTIPRVSLSKNATTQKALSFLKGTFAHDLKVPSPHTAKPQIAIEPPSTTFSHEYTVELRPDSMTRTAMSFSCAPGLRGREKVPYEVDYEGMIGSGRSKVYKGARLDTGDTVAVKVIVLPGTENHKDEIEKVSREFELISRLNHVNLLKYIELDVKLLERNIYLLMEYCGAGSLKKQVNQIGPLGICKARHYLRQILDGLQYLHSQNICHLDLKGENILLTHSDQVKIGDFGEMAVIEKTFSMEPDSGSFANIGTVQYMSPEMIRGDEELTVIGQPSDVWSFGCIALELLTGKTPKYLSRSSSGTLKEIEDTWSIMYFVGTEGRPFIPEDMNQDAVDFLLHCFKRDFSHRWSTNQLAKHRFLIEDSLEEGTNARNYSDSISSPYMGLRQQLLKI